MRSSSSPLSVVASYTYTAFDLVFSSCYCHAFQNKNIRTDIMSHNEGITKAILKDLLNLKFKDGPVASGEAAKIAAKKKAAAQKEEAAPTKKTEPEKKTAPKKKAVSVHISYSLHHFSHSM